MGFGICSKKPNETKKIFSVSVIEKANMKCMITGSRTLLNVTDIVNDTLDKVHEKTPINTIISGNAHGVDRIAEAWAEKNCIAVEIYLPDWKTYGKGAGILRNNEMVLASDVVVSFWDGKSRGTKQAMEKAARDGKLLKTINVCNDK